MENKTNWRHNNNHSQHHLARNVPILNFLSVKNKSNVARRGWNSQQRIREANMNITDVQILFKEPLVIIFISMLIFRSGARWEAKKFPLSSVWKCISVVDFIAVCGFYFPHILVFSTSGIIRRELDYYHGTQLSPDGHLILSNTSFHLPSYLLPLPTDNHYKTLNSCESVFFIY